MNSLSRRPHSGSIGGVARGPGTSGAWIQLQLYWGSVSLTPRCLHRGLSDANFNYGRRTLDSPSPVVPIYAG
jgi:hypothetical protein